MAYTTIDDPSAHFQTTTYTGSGSSGNAITNSGNSDLKPDWLWIKSRSDTEQHTLYDSSRGSTKRLMSDANNAEYVVLLTAAPLHSRYPVGTVATAIQNTEPAGTP